MSAADCEGGGATERFHLDLAGQSCEVAVSRRELLSVHDRLLSELAHHAAERAGRLIVFLAGPPGSGKSTLAALWETRAARREPPLALQALPMDGFHFPNAKLSRRTTVLHGAPVPLRELKGAPETFDLGAITAALRAMRAGKDVRWPRYDRTIHDPAAGVLPLLQAGVLVVEGNYLLLDEPGWRDLRTLADFTIRVVLPEDIARERILDRHTRGGRSRADAVAAYERVDLPNRARVLAHALLADAVIGFDRSSGLRTLSIKPHSSG